MAILNVFEPSTTANSLERLNKLSAGMTPKWGKMNAPQMLAHLNVAYDIAYGKTEVKKMGGFGKLMMKLFVKKIVVGEAPYKKNSRTAPYFLIADEREFNAEKEKLAAYIQQVEKDGASFFEGKESAAFGPLSAKEWSNQFQKHLDHHFQQFGI